MGWRIPDISISKYLYIYIYIYKYLLDIYIYIIDISQIYIYISLIITLYCYYLAIIVKSCCIMFYIAIEWVQAKPSQCSVGSLPWPLLPSWVPLSVVAALGVEPPALPRRFADWTSAWRHGQFRGGFYGGIHGDNMGMMAVAWVMQKPKLSSYVSWSIFDEGKRVLETGQWNTRWRGLWRWIVPRNHPVWSGESLRRWKASRNLEYFCWRWKPVSPLIANFSWSPKQTQHLIWSENQTLDCKTLNILAKVMHLCRPQCYLGIRTMLFGNHWAPLVQVSSETARETCHNMQGHFQVHELLQSYKLFQDHLLTLPLKRLRAMPSHLQKWTKTRIFIESGTEWKSWRKSCYKDTPW
jgi:hypothetical protein